MTCAKSCASVLAWLSRLALDTNAGVAIMIGIAGAVYAWHFLPWRGAPVEVSGVRAYAVPADDRYELVVVSDVTKHRVCPVQIVRYITDSRGEIRQLGQPTSNMTPTGQRRVSLRVALPLLPAGHYFYQAVATYDCQDGTFVVTSPLAAFSIPR